jgi:hypothetical protein
MKVQCSCGAKFAFEVTPEMADRPLEVSCPNCGADLSQVLTGLARQELATSGASASGTPVEPATPPLPQPPVPPRVRINKPANAPAQAPDVVAPDPSLLGQPCLKHPGQIGVSKCYICSKPICPKCMELFGHVCSPLCKAKADAHGITVPEYEQQASIVLARRWRRTKRLIIAGCSLMAVLVGVWFWYAWFGSEPRVVFSKRFDKSALAGGSALVGRDQIIVLHGGVLSRLDMKSGEEVWFRTLVDSVKIAGMIGEVMRQSKAAIDRANNEDPDHVPKMPDPDRLQEEMEMLACYELTLRCRGSNIWVASPDKLTRFEWDSGKTAQEIPLEGGFEGLIPRGDELLALDFSNGVSVVRHINLATGQTRSEQVGSQVEIAAAQGTNSRTTAGQATAAAPPKSRTGSAGTRASGLAASGPDRGLDPAKVAEQAQQLPLAGRIALPALLSSAVNRERVQQELDGSSGPRSKSAPARTPIPRDSFTFVPDREGFVEFSERLIEEKIVSRSAMKAAPAKSALENAPTVANTTEIANEILNEMQRTHGGDTVEEDESRYEVAIRDPATHTVWREEVVGPPRLYPLQTVNVVSANKLIIVLDKTGHKLWQSSLAYNVTAPFRPPDEHGSSYGVGPVAEKDGSLYVFDDGVLSAFDVKSGNARWRVPSVGITGIFFDDRGDMYVNTTTAGPDSLRYSKQIDVSSKTITVVMKVNCKTGKTIWTAEPGGLITYVSGPFVYSVSMYEGDDEEGSMFPSMGAQRRPFVRIKRLSPWTGKEKWVHAQQRAPLDIEFDRNSFRMVFKREVQVLRFLSL